MSTLALANQPPTPSGTLDLDPSAPTAPLPIPTVANPVIPLSSSTPVLNSSTASAASATSSTIAAANSIPLAAVIGAAIGAVVFLGLVVSLVIWHTRRPPRDGSIAKTRDWQRRMSMKEGQWKSINEKALEMKRMAALAEPEVPQLPPYVPARPLVTPSPNGTPSPHSGKPFINGTSPSLPSHFVQNPSPTQYAAAPYTTNTQNGQETPTSFYSMDSPANTPMKSSFEAQQQQQYSPPQAQSHAQHQNPFFSPHPESSTTLERWGSVPERTVTSPDSGASSERSPSRMEDLIAALDLGAGGRAAGLKPAKSQRGQLHSIYSVSSIAPNQSEPNMGMFDEVYDHEIRYDPTQARASFRSSIGVGLAPSEQEHGANKIITSAFPMPPPRSA